MKPELHNNFTQKTQNIIICTIAMHIMGMLPYHWHQMIHFLFRTRSLVSQFSLKKLTPYFGDYVYLEKAIGVLLVALIYHRSQRTWKIYLTSCLSLSSMASAASHDGTFALSYDINMACNDLGQWLNFHKKDWKLYVRHLRLHGISAEMKKKCRRLPFLLSG